MSKKGSYIGGNSIVSKNSPFFRKENNSYLTLNELNNAKRKKLEESIRKSINNCINNIKLLKNSNSPSSKNNENIIHYYLREIIISMFGKTKIGIKKKYRESIFDQLENLSIKNKSIKKYIEKYASKEVKEKLNQNEKSYIKSKKIDQNSQ